MVVKTDLHFWGTVLNLIKSKSKMKCMGWTRKPASHLLTDTCRDPRGMEHICLEGDLVGGRGHGALVLSED